MYAKYVKLNFFDLNFKTMKKTFLTFVAVGFGVSVAFAQTAPAEAQDAEVQTQTEAAAAPEAEVEAEEATETIAAGDEARERTKVEMSALPLATQVAFKNGEYSELEVLAVYEVAAEEGAEGKVYEFELAQEGETSEPAEIEGVEVEKVSDRQPDMILAIDENGQVVKEEKLDEEEAK